MKKINLLVVFLLIISTIGVSAAPPSVDSESFILTEGDTGTVICGKNADKQLKIASLTKIMTVLLTLEAVESGKMSFDDTVTASEYASSMGGSQIYLKEGEQMSLDDIIKAVVVASANDAAIALAEHVGGTYENFVSMMNEKASALGLKNTHFTDANGLSDADGHYSSAADMAIMARELLKHDEIKKYTMIWMDKLRGGEFDLNSTNILLKKYEGITGLKTGYTTEALYCMVASAERDGKSFISVVLGAPTTEERFGASERLLDYGFNDIKITDRIKKGSGVCDVDVKRGKSKTVKATVKTDMAGVVEIKDADTERHINLNKLTAPVKKGDVVGAIEIKSGDRVIASQELIAASDVERKNLFSYFSDFAKAFIGIF